MGEIETALEKIKEQREAELMEAVDIVCRFKELDKEYVLNVIAKMSETHNMTPEEVMRKRFGIDVEARRKKKEEEAFHKAFREYRPKTISASIGGEHDESVKAGIEKGRRLKEVYSKWGQVPFEEREKYQGDPETKEE
ncbi:MAG: hypothetical protein JW984_16155 [Deltaproteobacteria bacterium]|uniref:Uncharacterized protein n=1 Tax=Candidatus Zymogenus saltonus TaxID=2844893 RepID=A0A9D8PSE6_9DELT|nr:hypothetical protein [Candidatus Zymogenus saltonus]